MNSPSISTIRSPSDDWNSGWKATGVNPSSSRMSITSVIFGWSW